MLGDKSIKVWKATWKFDGRGSEEWLSLSLSLNLFFQQFFWRFLHFFSVGFYLLMCLWYLNSFAIPFLLYPISCHISAAFYKVVFWISGTWVALCIFLHFFLHVNLFLTIFFIPFNLIDMSCLYLLYIGEVSGKGRWNWIFMAVWIRDILSINSCSNWL